MCGLDQRDQRGIVYWATCNVFRVSSTLCGYDPRSARLRRKDGEAFFKCFDLQECIDLLVEFSAKLPNTDTPLDCGSSSCLWWFWSSNIESTFDCASGLEPSVHWILSRNSLSRYILQGQMQNPSTHHTRRKGVPTVHQGAVVGVSWD